MTEALFTFFLDNAPYLSLLVLAVIGSVLATHKWTKSKDEGDYDVKQCFTEIKHDISDVKKDICHIKDELKDVKADMKAHDDNDRKEFNDMKASVSKVHERVNQNSEDIKELTGFMKGKEK